MDSTKDYYSILQISQSESFPNIHRAYRRLAKQHHPDHAGSQGAPRFRDIQEAYYVLSNPERRQRYDDGLQARRAYIKVKAEPIVAAAGAVQPEPFSASSGDRNMGHGDRILRHACRTDLYEFACLAELLLSPLLLSSPLTEDELDFLRLYLRELTDRYGM